MPGQEQVLSLIGLLYDATLDTAKWQPFLKQCCQVFDAHAAQWAYHTPMMKEISFSSFYNLNENDFSKYQALLPRDPRGPDTVNEHWHPGVPEYTAHKDFERFRSGFACRDTTFVRREDLRQSEMYQKVLEPNNVEYTIAITHQLDDSEVVFLALMRGKKQQEFTDRECELLNLLRDHVKQAAIIHRQLSQLDFDRRSALETLDSLNMGLVLVDQYQQILFANQLGRAILDASDGCRQSEQMFELADQKANNKLRDAIREVIEQTANSQQTPGRAMSINRPSGKAAYSLLVSPLWSNLVRVQSGALDYPIVSLFIQDPEIQQNSLYSLLKDFYQLTPRETDILVALLQGQTTNTIASNLDIQANTVRQHLKNIFSKTETTSQAELVQTIMASPLWLGSHEFAN